MRPDLARRLLALPPDIRATLAGVPGPGWSVEHKRGGSIIALGFAGNMSPGWAWWPANPAGAVAAVTGRILPDAYAMIGVRMFQHQCDDQAAALSIIEAHVARSHE